MSAWILPNVCGERFLVLRSMLAYIASSFSSWRPCRIYASTSWAWFNNCVTSVANAPASARCGASAEIVNNTNRAITCLRIHTPLLHVQRAKIVRPLLQTAQVQPFDAPRVTELFHHVFDDLPFLAAIYAHPSERHLS